MGFQLDKILQLGTSTTNCKNLYEGIGQPLARLVKTSLEITERACFGTVKNVCTNTGLKLKFKPSIVINNG
jgi:hypothetical protein